MTESAPGRSSPPPLPPLSLKAKLLLIGFGLGLALVAAEAALRIVGYNPGIPFQERDPEYGWRNVRNSHSLSSLGYPVRINSRGGRGPEFAPAKPGGVFRIIALGCSCTIADNVAETETYPARLQERLNARAPRERRFEAINAGVGGFSTFMGRKWLAREVIGWQPDLITIYYGWNDHWVARAGGSDREVDSSNSERLKNRILKLKLGQLLYQFRSTETMVRAESWLRSRLAPGAPTGPAPAGAPVAGGGDVTRGYRVPLTEYEQNLKAMIALARERGTRVILIAAPLQYPVLDRHRTLTAATVPFIDGTDPDNVAANHHLYTDVVREVGREEGVPVADLEAVFNALTQAERDRLFTDFVHPNAAGFELFTAELERVFAAAWPELLAPAGDPPPPAP